MRRISILSLTLFTFAASAAWPQAQAPNKQRIITFDAPGAGTAAGQGTTALGIVPNGTISGFYADASSVLHGFLRAPRYGTLSNTTSARLGQL